MQLYFALQPNNISSYAAPQSGRFIANMATEWSRDSVASFKQEISSRVIAVRSPPSRPAVLRPLSCEDCEDKEAITSCVEH